MEFIIYNLRASPNSLSGLDRNCKFSKHFTYIRTIKITKAHTKNNLSKWSLRMFLIKSLNLVDEN